MSNNRKEQLEAMLTENKNDPFLYFALAKEFEKEGDFKTALTHYEDLGHNFPNYVGTYYHWAKVLIRLENTDEAIRIVLTGCQIAQQQKDHHAHSELKIILLELDYEDED